MSSLVLVVVLIVGAAAVTWAQPNAPGSAPATDKKASQQLYRDGQNLYNVGDYAGAVSKFKEAYLKFPAPLLLFNLAQAYRLSGDCEQALRTYRTYLREKPDADNRAQVETAIELCEKQPSVQSDTTAQQDRETQQGTEKPSRPEDDPPAEVAAVDPPPSSEVVQVQSQPAMRDDGSPGRGKRLVGLAMIGVGAATLATGGYFAWRAHKDAQSIENFDGTWDQSWQEVEDRQARNRILGPSLMAVGVTVAGAGVVMYLLGRRDGHESPPVAVQVSGDSLAVQVGGSF